MNKNIYFILSKGQQLMALNTIAVKVLTPLLLCLSLTYVHAQGTLYRACIYNDGTLKGTFQLRTKPVITFSGDDIIISTYGIPQVEMNALGTKVTFVVDEPTTIVAVQNVTDAPLYSIRDGSIVANGLIAGEVVSMYTIDGRQLSTKKADVNGCVTMPSYHGLVILTTRNMSYKIHLK